MPQSAVARGDALASPDDGGSLQSSLDTSKGSKVSKGALTRHMSAHALQSPYVGGLHASAFLQSMK